jgi:hypothetical protein
MAHAKQNIMTTAAKVKHKDKSLESQIAAEYIDSMGRLLQRQSPHLSNADIRRRILYDCEKVFPKSLINESWPPWLTCE